MMTRTLFAPSRAAISSSSPASASAASRLSALLDEQAVRAAAGGRPVRRRGRRTSRRRRSTSSICSWRARRRSSICSTTSRRCRSTTARRFPRSSFPKGERFAFIKGTPRLLGSPFTFKKYGQSGAELSELLPHLATIADDIAIVRSMHTTQFNHAPGQIFMNTGSQVFGRPSIGSWLTYGLGSESRDLPGFVVLLSGENAPDGGKSCWGSGFLPTVYQGVEFRSKGDPVLFVSNPDGVDTRRAARIDRSRDRSEPAAPRRGRRSGDRHAHRVVRDGLPDAEQRAGADRHLERAGADPRAVRHRSRARCRSPTTACWRAAWSSAACGSCSSITAAGTRTARASATDIATKVPELCLETDRAATALVRDLKQRGLLDTTLVIWGGEFGRTPMNEARGGSRLMGRDHHPRAFTIWMAGGGVKPGHHASAAPTISATTSSRIPSRSTICTRPSCT